MALLDRLTHLFDRPDVVVHDRVAVRRIADAFEPSVGAANDADDAVVGDCYSSSGRESRREFTTLDYRQDSR